MSKSHFGSTMQRPGRPGFYVRFRRGGKRVWRYGGPTKAEAEEKRAHAQILANRNRPLHEILAEVFGEGDTERLTFKAAAEQYLEEARREIKPSTYGMAQDYYRAINRESWAGRLVTEIRPRDLSRWVNRLLKQGVRPSRKKPNPQPLSPASTNRYRSAVSVVFQWCMRNEYIETNPCRALRQFSESGNGRDIILTQKEALHLIDQAPDEEFREILLLAIFTGLRRGEITTLQWGDVSLKRREIIVAAKNSKTSRGRTIPMLGVVHGVLERRHAARSDADGTGLVFGRAAGEAWTPIMFRRRWNSLIARAKKLPAPVRSGLVFHSLRHCFASFLINAGQSLDVIADLLGHSLTSTTRQYAHLLPKRRKAAVRAIEKGLRFASRKGALERAL